MKNPHQLSNLLGSKALVLSIFLSIIPIIGFCQPANDDFANAIEVTSIIGTCSADEAYTTINATADLNPGSCWNNSGPQFNVWFWFEVPSTGEIYIKVDRGGTKGTQRRTQLALWKKNGTTAVDCEVYNFNDEDVDLSQSGLTPGDTLYISVDAFNASYDGTFTLCIDSLVDYDMYEGAIDVTSVLGGCSADEAYTTIGASADRSAGSCWNNSGPQFNRWFYFTAPTTGIVNITVDRGGSKGTQRRTQLALWEADGTTEVECELYAFNDEDVDMGYVGLTPGATYYISVDAFNTSYYGSFTLCIDTIADYDFYEGAIDVTPILGGCSADAAYTTIGASADRSAGSCWNNSGPQFNRWFYFVAPSTGIINITIDRGGSKGTQRRTQLALWEVDGTTEVDCKIYAFNDEDVELGAIGLTPGDTFYISVDAFNTSYDGSFTLCIDTTASYDFYEGAIDITSYIGGCTPDAIYATIGGSSDQLAGSCWNNSGPRFNKWFKFTAPASGQINILIDRGGSKGTQRRTQLALWETDGITEVGCKIYAFNDEDVEISEPNLTPGATYYISVDAFNTSYDGSFTICLDDEVSYDYFEGAIELTDLNNWCSSDAEFTTIGGSPDQLAGSCWNNSGPRFNKWFKFTAVSNTVTITVDRGGSQGTQRRTQLALWESDGTTERQCVLYTFNDEDVSLSDGTLTVGNTYYISVDAFNTSYDGSFTLCIDNIDTEYYSITDGNWNNSSTWSIVSHAGAPAATFPSTGDVVYIQDHEVTVNVDEACAEVRLNVSADNTRLTLDGNDLNVAGKVSMINTGNNFDCNIDLVSGSNLTINDDLILDRQGGNNVFEVSLANNTSIDINKDLLIQSSGGVVTNSEILLAGNSTLTVGENLTFTESSQISVGEDLTFTATADDKVEIEMNNSSSLSIAGDIVLGSPAYGILDFNNSSTLVFNGSSKQTLPTFNGSGGTDIFDVDRIILNNSFGAIPQLELSDDLTIEEYISFLDGVIDCNGNTLIFETGAYTTGDNNGSYVDGPVQFNGAGDAYFPTGDGSVWAPVELENLTGDASTVFTVEYFYDDYGNNSVTAPLTHVSIIEYWDLENTGTASSADVTLYFKNTTRSEIDDFADLVIAHYNSGTSKWETFGQDNVIGANPGSITVDGVSSFSPFSFGSLDENSNPLPVELLSFDAFIADDESIKVNWITLSEINNDYFEVERSSDGIKFNKLAKIAGAGNSASRIDYEYTDLLPPYQSNQFYYRLKQVDYDGASTYYGPIQLYRKTKTELEFNAYPNPIKAGDLLKIDLKNTNGSKVLLSLTELNGRIVFQKELNSDQFEGYSLQIPSHLKSGLYLLNMTDGQDQFNLKLTVH